jgi:hypothetical protein
MSFVFIAERMRSVRVASRDKAVITEVDGAVHHGPVVKCMRRIIIETDEGTRHEYSVPRSVHVNVQEGERVRAGDPLNAMLAAARRVRSTRTTFWPFSVSRNCSVTWPTRSRRSTARGPLSAGAEWVGAPSGEILDDARSTRL